MGKIGVYSGKALETEEKIKGDISAWDSFWRFD